MKDFIECNWQITTYNYSEPIVEIALRVPVGPENHNGYHRQLLEGLADAAHHDCLQPSRVRSGWMGELPYSEGYDGDVHH